MSLCRVTLKGSDTVEAVVVGSVSVLEVQQNVGLHRGSGVCVCVCVRACVRACVCMPVYRVSCCSRTSSLLCIECIDVKLLPF